MRIRQGLNVESGLNDGIVLPVVTIALAISAAEAGGIAQWGDFVGRQIGFGLLCGIAAGAGGGVLLRGRVATRSVEGVYRQLATIAVVAAAYAAAELSGGNGFIAALTAVKNHTVR